MSEETLEIGLWPENGATSHVAGFQRTLLGPNPTSEETVEIGLWPENGATSPVAGLQNTKAQ